MNSTYLRKTILIFFIPFVLLAQMQKKDLTKLPYNELKNMYFDNEQDASKQMEYAKAYLIKAKSENNLVQKAKGYYLCSLLQEPKKAIVYLDSSIASSKNSNDIKFPAYAYSEKAYALQKQFKFKNAIDNFLLAEKIAKKNNTDFYYKVKFSIAALRSEELGEVDEALALYKECFNYYKDKEIRSSKYSFSYQLTIFALADAYKGLNQTDSATYYNNLGYEESKITENTNLNSLFILNEGANLILKKNYKTALDSIDKALPKIILLNDQGNILAAYYYKAKIYDGLKIKNEAVKNFKKVDSMNSITKRITPEFISGYPYLIDYYKEKGDKDNELKYLQKYTNINKTLQNNYKELSKKLEIEYDIPHLISEKESLIRSLKKENKNSYWGIGGLILLFIFVSYYGYYQYNLKNTYRFRFEEIINRDKNPREKITETDAVNTATLPKNKKELGIDSELVSQIINKLNQFEVNKGFLESNITVQILAELTDTNSKYLSKIVNNIKEKTFTKYINDLRIDYAINELQQDYKLQNYTIQALAQEFGFNNAESFSTAFYKKVGIKPRYFIEKISVLKSIN